MIMINHSKTRMDANPSHPAQRGSTMIEVLVAILILALGMMGMLGLFINSLKIGSGSMYRNSATQHAYMMADIIRSNFVNLPSYFSPTASATSSCFTSTGCSTTLMPNTEYQLWQTQLSSLLPAGQGKVCRDATANTRAQSPTSTFLACDDAATSQIVVKVCWDESRIRASNAGVSNAATTGIGGAQCIFTNL